MDEYDFKSFDDIWQRVTAREELPEIHIEKKEMPPEAFERQYPISKAIRFLPDF